MYLTVQITSFLAIKSALAQKSGERAQALSQEAFGFFALFSFFLGKQKRSKRQDGMSQYEIWQNAGLL
jgi:hypothetical protein